MREEIANAGIQRGYTLKYDVSLSTSHYYKLVEETRLLIKNSNELTNEEKQQLQTVGYGHVGDGNLHLNVSLIGYYDKELQTKVN